MQHLCVSLLFFFGNRLSWLPDYYLHQSQLHWNRSWLHLSVPGWVCVWGSRPSSQFNLNISKAPACRLIWRNGHSLPFLSKELLFACCPCVFFSVYITSLHNSGVLAAQSPFVQPSCLSFQYFFFFFLLNVSFCGFVAWTTVNALMPLFFFFFSLLTFPVSRIPFREDSPADIIPPPWADRSVVHKSYLAANASGEKSFKCHSGSFSRQLTRVRKLFVQVGAFSNELDGSSSLALRSRRRKLGTEVNVWLRLQLWKMELKFPGTHSVHFQSQAPLFCDGLWPWSCRVCCTVPQWMSVSHTPFDI